MKMFNRKFYSNRLTKGACLGAILATTVVLPACSNNEQVEAQGNVSTEEVSEQTEQLLGQTVTVRSEVEQEVGNTGFVLEDDQLFGGEPILVVNATGTPFVLPQDDDTSVQVTGKVAQFVISDLDTEYGLDLDPNLYVDYENKPAVIAESIALAPEPEELAEDPEAYYNKIVAVEGDVDEIYSPSTFTIGDDGWFEGGELLVVGVDSNFGSNPKIQEGENVTVTGVLRPYIKADFDREYNLTWDLDLQRQVEAEYTQKPVLAATEVYPSAVDQ